MLTAMCKILFWKKMFYHDNIVLHILAKECCLSVTATADVYNIGAHHIVYFDNFAVRNVF